MKELKKQEKEWVLYDVGNSAFVLLCTTIIPIYFKNIAAAQGLSSAQSTAYLSYALSVCTILVALSGPVLGTLSDTQGHKKPMFLSFLVVGVLGCLSLAIPKDWLVFLVLLVLAKTAYSLSLIFYDAMLTDVTTDDRMDLVSSHGYAWGYIGSCIPFVACLLLVLMAEKIGISQGLAIMISFGITGIWWFAVTIPLLRHYEQKYGVPNKKNAVKESFIRIWEVLGNVNKDKKILYFLIAFFFYIDGVYTIIDLATSYGKDVGISDTHLLLAFLMTQIVAFPCALIFGKISARMKSETLIQISILGYLGISLFALQLDHAWEFWFLAVCVAVFQGSIQALSRSYFAKIIPKEKASEYFGFYDIFGKGAAFMGTMLIGICTQLSGSSRTGVASLSFMFVIGFFFFRKTASIEK